MLDPRQSLFREYYTNPKSETFSNAYRSALAAGFADDYAKVITAESTGLEWVKEILNDEKRLKKAEKVLEKTLDFVEDENVLRQRLAQDTAKFIAKGLGKRKYSERTELTGADGKDLPTPILSLADEVRSNNSNEKDPLAEQKD